MSDSAKWEAIFSIVLALVCIPAGCALMEYSCGSRAEKMGFRGDWGPIQGCMVKVDRQWIPIESYRVLAE